MHKEPTQYAEDGKILHVTCNTHWDRTDPDIDGAMIVFAAGAKKIVTMEISLDRAES